jgi:single-strand DNA-binding protein
MPEALCAALPSQDKERAMNETYVTVQGYVGTEPEEKVVGSAVVATFRVGSTPRRFNKLENSWVDSETNWYTVNAWRTLGQHCLESVHVREPVIVHGRLRANAWKDAEGRTHQSLVVDAVAVGHDLCRGTTTYTKAQPAQGQPGEDDELRAFNALLASGSAPQMTSDGDVIEDPAA